MRDFLTVHQSENVTFTDLAALNLALEKNGNELGEGFLQNFNGAYNGKRDPLYNGFFRLSDEGIVEVFYHYDRADSEYGEMANVFGSFCDTAASIIACFMDTGKLVLYYEEHAYYVITPGDVDIKRTKALKF